MSILSDIITAAGIDTLTSEQLAYNGGAAVTGTFHELPEIDADRPDGHIRERLGEGYILVSNLATMEREKKLAREDGSVWLLTRVWKDGKALVWRFECRHIDTFKRGRV